MLASYCSDTFGRRASFLDSRKEGDTLVRFFPFLDPGKPTSVLEFFDLREFFPSGIDVRTSDPSDS